MRAVILLAAALTASAQPSPIRPKALPPVIADYTPEARAARIEGVAAAWAEIDRSGKVVDAGLFQGLGMSLDDKALEAVRNFRFDPAAVDPGQASTLIAAVDVHFALPNGPHWRIAHLVHRFQPGDRQADPATRKAPVLTNPVLRKYARPDDAACANGSAVTLFFPIDAAGAPGDVEVVAGDPAATKAAATAIAGWRFDPARRNGDPVSSDATVLMKCRVPEADRPEIYRVGGSVTAPRLLQKVEPNYSEEARAAKFQGTVLLYTEIGPYGYAEHMRVTRPLGLGLDVKAMEAVRQWQFAPGLKGGSPVTVAANIEVNFRLL